ncbi:hypothetical protein [Sanguibacter suaedae]|uniref:Uncharacterized protein n=1 Tax=Sanguibacter suaedae TaxID=2795737 RepID=A0A934ICF5_9MICO|nr:hypothetical protein [Sanguibacter suaedae]MBI9115296.1 hypothetical protein [Sanguibacter suaedae]
MSARHTLVRSMHDIGLASWFGGSLMGAVGLNGAAAAAKDPQERVALAAKGWARWTPVVVASVGLHTLGSIGLIAGNAKRLEHQEGARTNTVVKGLLTVAAAATTLYAGGVGKTQHEHADEGAPGATEASRSSSAELTAAQEKQKALQWAIPALTGVLIVLAAQQGEQQRPLGGRLHGR